MTIPPGSTIGIVGGGQLGRMLSVAAAQLGYRFSVLTTLAHRAPLRERAALLAGLDRRLASCRPLDLPVLDTVVDRERVLEKIVRIGRQAIDTDGAEVLVLGCAGLGDLSGRASAALGVPIIDPNAAALKLCETLVDLVIHEDPRHSEWEPLRGDLVNRIKLLRFPPARRETVVTKPLILGVPLPDKV